MEKAYTIKVLFERHGEDDEVFNQLIKIVEANLTAGLPASIGRANAKVISVDKD